MEISFEKYPDGRWFVILPEYQGLHDDLEMVDGADKLLDALTEDNLYVNLEVSLTASDFWTKSTLELVSHDECGAYYKVKGCHWFDGTIWLCNVVHEIFGEHPEEIHFIVV